jgi:magnesium transporter
MEYFGKIYHPPGTPPGTLTATGEALAGECSIHLLDFTGSEILEQVLTSPGEGRAFLERDSVTWIHLQGNAKAETLKDFGDIFALHPLALEDILNKGQRPKVEEYDDLLFVILAMPEMVNNTIKLEQVSVFLGKNFILSFHSGSIDPFEPLRARIRKAGSRMRTMQADFVLYSILDLVIDQGFPVLESFGETIEDIEEQLLTMTAEHDTLEDIHYLRRELLVLWKNLWPQRDIINTLLRNDHALIHENTLMYLRDCYDHTIQIIELIENYREMASGMIDLYLSSASHRLNDIMRVLTVFASIFIPLTFVVGVYGMNFSHPDSPWAMPELHWYYGYPMIWGIMIVIVGGMLIYFKRKNWF